MNYLIDIVRPICPHSANHRHYQKIYDLYPKQVLKSNAQLKVFNPHVCESRMLNDSHDDIKLPKPGEVIRPTKINPEWLDSLLKSFSSKLIDTAHAIKGLRHVPYVDRYAVTNGVLRKIEVTQV